MNTKSVAAYVASNVRFADAYGFLRRKLKGSQVAILVYHRVAPKEDTWSLESVNPETFENHLKYLCQNYEFLTLDNLVQSIRKEIHLPKKAVVLTFDDGYKDNYLYAYPILKQYGIPATIFLTTGYIGTGKLFWWDMLRYTIQHTTVNYLNLEEFGSYSLASNEKKIHASNIITKKMKELSESSKNLLLEKLFNTCSVDIPPDIGNNYILSWDEVKEMSGNGIEFGAHSVNHPILVNIPFHEAKQEIVRSKVTIEKKLGKPVTLFAYPNGDFNPRLAKFIEETGFTCAVSLLPSTLIESTIELYDLSRIEMDGDFHKCQVRLCGLLGDLRAILRRNS